MISDERFHELLETRARAPERIAECYARRRRRPLFGEDGKLFIIAVDHTARSVLKVGSNPYAMADRRTLLERAMTALEQPGVDGVLATPDVMEDLLLLGALEDRVAIASMNRGGLAGSAWELDDRFTAYDPEQIAAAGLDGGKMLLRLDMGDPASNETLAACARAVSALARAGKVAMVEPLPAAHEGGALTLKKDAHSLLHAVCVAAGLGHTSAYTWLKVPVVEGMEQVIAATTLPMLLLGGDPGPRAAEVFAGWRRALAYPQVRGLVAGRALLFPEDGDVAGAVRQAAAMVHGAELVHR
jgi:DhnA family fructose-bisphosphate aldolase class Ia